MQIPPPLVPLPRCLFYLLWEVDMAVAQKEEEEWRTEKERREVENNGRQALVFRPHQRHHHFPHLFFFLLPLVLCLHLFRPFQHALLHLLLPTTIILKKSGEILEWGIDRLGVGIWLVKIINGLKTTAIRRTIFSTTGIRRKVKQSTKTKTVPTR